MINTVVIRGPKATGYLPHEDWESAFETWAAIESALEGTGIEVELYDNDGDQYEPPQPDSLTDQLVDIATTKAELTQAETDALFDRTEGVFTELPPTPGLHKLGGPAQAAARSRAKAFYPFD